MHSQGNNKMKRQPMEREKIFSNHLSEKRLIQELIQFCSNDYYPKDKRSVGKDIKGKRTLVHGWWECNLVQALCKIA